MKVRLEIDERHFWMDLNCVVCGAPFFFEDGATVSDLINVSSQTNGLQLHCAHCNNWFKVVIGFIPLQKRSDV